MRTIYKTSFKVGNDRERIPVRDLVRTVHSWRNKFDHISFEDFSKPGKFENGKSETEIVASKENFGLRHTEKDAERPEVIWRTDIAIVKDNQERPEVNIELAKAWKNPIISPVGELVTRPGVVRDIIDNFQCYNGIRLKSTPTQITNPSNINDFIALINEPRRNVPVIYFSRTNERGLFLTNPNFVASKLAGIGFVTIPQSSCASFDIDKRLEENYGIEERCYDGAVRVFWPRKDEKTRRGDYLFHPDVVELPDFSNQILTFISRSSLFMTSTKTFPEIKADMIQESLESSGAHAGELIQIYSDERNQALRDYSIIKGELETKESELFQLRTRVQKLEEAVKNRNIPERRVEIESCADAFNLAKELPGISVHSRVEDQARKSRYNNPLEVYNALRWISKAIRGEISGDLRESAMKELTLEYSPHQSELTMSQYQDEYSILVGGKRVWLPAHLKKGNGRDPETSFRLAWGIQKENKKAAIIGYFGQHQTNRKT